MSDDPIHVDVLGQNKVAPSSREQFATVVRVTSGNLLEMYDFMVYGYYAKAIARAFFPSDDPFASLMASLAAFGAGFLMRPLGAIVLGSYIDRVGRKQGLILTLALMALGSLMIACVPTYATIGALAPLIVVSGRLLQGFSAGVELGGVSVYLSEMATPGRKGFYVSWQSASQQLAVIGAASIGYLLNQQISPQDMGDWGWRIPFLIGCLIVPFLFVIRRSLQETEAFEARKRRPELPEILATMRRNWALITSGMMLVVMTTVSFYVITAYTPTFGHELHFSDKDNLLVTMCVGLSNFFWLPVMGALSDKVGRRPLLFVFTILMAFTAYPSMRFLAGAPSFATLLGVELWFSFLYASYNGAMVVALTEVMPPEVRTAGFSLAYSLATALFGGFTPMICTWLIHRTSDPASPGLWLTFAAICGLVSSAMIFRLKPVVEEV